MGREPSRDLRRHSYSFVYHVTSLWRLSSCFAVILFCDDTVTRKRWYGSNVSTVLMGREQSRHPFAIILLVTALWRLPSCFATILFCAETITRRRCGARSKIKYHRLLCRYDCQLGLGLVTLILTSVVNPYTYPKRTCRFQVNRGDRVTKRRSPR